MRRYLKVLALILFPILLQAGLQDFKLIEAAKAAYKAGKYDRSAALLNRLQEENAPLQYDLGNAYYKAGKYAKALLHYKRAKGEGVDPSTK